jgi:hypothetical protein
MILELIYGILGPWSRTFVNWSIDHPLPVGLLAAALLGIWLSSKYQLNKIEKATKQYSLEASRAELDKNPRIKTDELYDRIFPGWSEMVLRTAWFVPHRWELWPVPTNPEKVRDQVKFTPEWLEQFLLENGIEVQPSPEGKEKKTV